METGKELAGNDGQPCQQAHDAPLVVRFLATGDIAGQEIELVMASLEEIMAEMRRIESGAIQEASPDQRSHPLIQGA